VGDDIGPVEKVDSFSVECCAMEVTPWARSAVRVTRDMKLSSL
jgi:hypothetical protein